LADRQRVVRPRAVAPLAQKVDLLGAYSTVIGTTPRFRRSRVRRCRSAAVAMKRVTSRPLRCNIRPRHTVTRYDRLVDADEPNLPANDRDLERLCSAHDVQALQQDFLTFELIAAENLAARLEEKCRALGLPCLSILGLLFHLISVWSFSRVRLRRFSPLKCRWQLSRGRTQARSQRRQGCCCDPQASISRQVLLPVGTKR
jgi:hypothetical protein